MASWLPRISASLFWQDYKRELAELRYSILADNPAAGVNSSYASRTVIGPTGPVTVTDFTGKPSAYINTVRANTINKLF